jgi:hypothetical protein
MGRPVGRPKSELTKKLTHRFPYSAMEKLEDIGEFFGVNRTKAIVKSINLLWESVEGAKADPGRPQRERKPVAR